MKNNVLCIVAHGDDEVLGVGGTLLKHTKNGDNVSIMIIGDGVGSRHNFKCDDYLKDKTDRVKMSTKAANFIKAQVYFEDFADNAFDRYTLLSITKRIETVLDIIKPNIIYTHNHSDLNIDHKLTFEATITACRPVLDYIKEIYAFETVSSTEWQAPQMQQFKPQVFVELSNEIMSKKLELLDIYSHEMRGYPHPRSVENVVNKAKVNGSIVLKNNAEAFEVIRIMK